MADIDKEQKKSSPPFLGGLSSSDFLKIYWQKKSLFISNAFPQWVNCLDPNDLAGYSLEEQIESRILIEESDTKWEVLHGPFQEDLFASLPKTNWTLLVQAVDHYFPDFAELLDQFNFLPQWRIDDIMMSYAVTGGNVGPHYDYYDVFLIQISGRRHWKIGQMCNDQSDLINGLPVRILADFDTIEEHTVEPGDVLYLPPGMAHHGVALDDDCITLSVGFRAPGHADLLSEYSHHIASSLPGQARYADPNLKPRDTSPIRAGILTNEDVSRFKEQMLYYLDDPEALKIWLAEYLSLPKYDSAEPITNDIELSEVLQQLKHGTALRRDEASRFLITEINGATTLYINGKEFQPDSVAPELLGMIASKRTFSYEDLKPHVSSNPGKTVLSQLIKQGWLYLPYED